MDLTDDLSSHSYPRAAFRRGFQENPINISNLQTSVCVCVCSISSSKIATVQRQKKHSGSYGINPVICGGSECTSITKNYIGLAGNW